jgi:hypothetical protein
MVGTLVCGFVAAHWWLARRWGSAAANNIVSLAANLWFVAAGAAGVGRYGLFGTAYAPAFDWSSFASFRCEWVESVLVCPMLAYQAYNTLVAFADPEHRTPANLAHHMAAMWMAWVSLTGPFVQSLAPFFFGLVEASTVALCVKGLLSRVPAWRAGRAYAASRAAFAVLFMAFRGVLFPVGYGMSIWAMWRSPAHHTPQNAVAALASTALLALQYVWAGKIVAAIVGR